MSEIHDYMQIAVNDAFEKLRKTAKLNDDQSEKFREYYNDKCINSFTPFNGLAFIQRCIILNEKYGLSVDAFCKIADMDINGKTLDDAQKLLESGIFIFNAKYI